MYVGQVDGTRKSLRLLYNIDYRKFLNVLRNAVLSNRYPRINHPADWRKDLPELETAALYQTERLGKDVSLILNRGTLDSFYEESLKANTVEMAGYDSDTFFNQNSFVSLSWRQFPSITTPAHKSAKAVGEACHVWSVFASESIHVRDRLYWAQAMTTFAHEYDDDFLPSTNIFALYSNSEHDIESVFDSSVQLLQKAIDDEKIPEDDVRGFFYLAEQEGGPFLDYGIFQKYRKNNGTPTSPREFEAEFVPHQNNRPPEDPPRHYISLDETDETLDSIKRRMPYIDEEPEEPDGPEMEI